MGSVLSAEDSGIQRRQGLCSQGAICGTQPREGTRAGETRVQGSPGRAGAALELEEVQGSSGERKVLEKCGRTVRGGGETGADNPPPTLPTFELAKLGGWS